METFNVACINQTMKPEVLLHPHNYCNNKLNMLDENPLTDDGMRLDNTTMHSALLKSTPVPIYSKRLTHCDLSAGARGNKI